MSLLTEQPFIIDTVNDTETTDTKNVTSITISGELDYNKKNTYLDKGLNYETISKIVNAPTESEANRITKIVEDSTESEAIGITTVPSSTEPDAIDITTVPGSTTEPVTVTIGKITETAEDSMKQETIQVTTASGSTEQEAIEITTVPDSEESETIEIPATFPSSTTIEPTRTVQDSTESEEIGFTTFPSSTEPDEMAITKTGYEQSECVNEGFFGDSENCSKFYRCVQFAFKFIKYEFFCPRGTIWDDRLKTCNFRAAVKEINCKDLNKYPLFPFAEQNAVNPVDNLEDRVALVCPTGFRQHPNYCNAFYQCIVNENLEYHLTVFLCPVGSIFDQDNIRCSRDLSIQRNSCVNLGIAEKQLFSRIVRSTFDQRYFVVALLLILSHRRRFLSFFFLQLKHSEITMCPTEGQFQYGGGCASDYLYCKRDQLGTLEGYLFHCPRGQLFSPIENKCVSSTLSSLCN